MGFIECPTCFVTLGKLLGRLSGWMFPSAISRSIIGLCDLGSGHSLLIKKKKKGTVSLLGHLLEFNPRVTTLHSEPQRGAYSAGVGLGARKQQHRLPAWAPSADQSPGLSLPQSQKDSQACCGRTSTCEADIALGTSRCQAQIYLCGH